MAKSVEKSLLVAKQHATAGVDPVPTGGANAMLISNLMIKPLKGDFVPRNLLRGFKGNSGKLLTAHYREMTFEVEIAGAGAAGTAPAYGVLLKGAHHSETVNAGTSVVYAPVDSLALGLALYGHYDGSRFIMLDAEGGVTADFNAKGIPVFKFRFIGTYQAGTDIANPTGTYTSWTKPLTVGKVNTPTLTLHGFAAICETFAFDQGNALSWVDRIGRNGPNVPDREPTVKAQVEWPTIAAKDYFEIARLGTEGALQLIHGTVAGNIVQFDATRGQIDAEPDGADNNQDRMLNLSFSLNPLAGGDDYSWTIR